MKLFFQYLKMHIKSMLIFAVFVSVFSVISYLYSMPHEAIAYSVMLCFAFGIIMCIVSFLSFKKRHETMLLLIENISAGIENLPEPRNIREADYIELVKAVDAEKNHIVSEHDDAVRDMTDYYTMWVHQIKTPIAAMNLLLQQNPDDELSEQLFRINNYVEMVLTYIRCDSKTNDLVLKNTDMDEVVKGSVRKFAKSFIRKKLSLDYDNLNMTVLTDEKWISFVIEQILSNSLKYTKDGGIRIYREGDRTLVIEDTGIGISPEDLPRVCEKGYTGYNGREDKKSTGIGLFLCKQVIKMLGHRMSVASEEGKGTKVSIVFINNNTIYE